MALPEISKCAEFAAPRHGSFPDGARLPMSLTDYLISQTLQQPVLCSAIPNPAAPPSLHCSRAISKELESNEVYAASG